MGRFEVTAECTITATFTCDTNDDAREEMYRYLSDIGMDADMFSMYVEDTWDDMTGQEMSDAIQGLIDKTQAVLDSME